MNTWLSWVVPLLGAILLSLIPALFRGYSLLALLTERVESNKQSIASERDARMAADNEQCRRINDIEDTLEDQGMMLGRIDERTGMIVAGLQRAGVVDSNPNHR